MLPTTSPTVDGNATFSLCISRIQDAGLQRRLRQMSNAIANASQDYESRAATIRFYLLQPARRRGVTKKELTDVYTLRFAKKGSVGRRIYDQIISLAPLGICPLCGVRPANTLDHYLPKKAFPEFSVFPKNLVPACDTCNKTKSDDVPADKNSQTLHPYFENFDDKIWLHASLKRTYPVTFSFRARRVSDWTRSDFARVQNHIEVFGLNKLYSLYASQELLDISHLLKTLLESNGSDAVRVFLKEAYDSRKSARKNSWQTALYRVLYQSDWFCNGGFQP